MPELPEVETIRRQLNNEIKGSVFTGVKTDAGKIFKPTVGEVREIIIGRKIEGVDRQAKVLILNLTGGYHLLFHLKMTGRLLVRPISTPPDDYTHAVFGLESGKKALELRFADARKFGFVKLIRSAKELESLRAGYGPEPFKDLDLKNFKKTLSSTRRPIKIILLDQTKISGVGNIYANDSLWLAKINPKTPANKIGNVSSQKLYRSLLTVLKSGLAYGGASDQWYRQVHGEKGKYQEHFLVYGRVGEPCLRCKTLIERAVIGGRGTFYCPKCQQQ